MTPIQDLVDAVWGRMSEGEFYSPNDLVSMLGCSTEAVARVLDFLIKYKFVRKFSPELFFKIPNTLPPKGALAVLQLMIEDKSKQTTHSLGRSQP